MWPPMSSARTIIHLAFAAFLFAPKTAKSADENYGELTIHIVSLWGSKLPGGKLSIYSNNDGVSVYSRYVNDDVTLRLKYGEYKVTFDSTFLKPVNRNVTIDRTEHFVLLATTMVNTILDVKMEPVAVTIRVRPPDSCIPGE